MSDNYNKPTIILGAGTAIEIGAPTTATITQEIIKPKKYQLFQKKDIFGNTLFFKTLSNIYNQLKCSYPKEPNFEQIFHVAEILFTYKRVWFKNCKNPDIFPVFAPFVVPITKVVPPIEWDELDSLIQQCQFDIMEMINKYDMDFCKKNKTAFSWYKNFWRGFKGFDLFNFNYDTTIEHCLDSYVDGFVDSDDERFKTFNPKELFDLKNNFVVCHPHGCIVYYKERYKDINHDVYEYNSHDQYKWNDFSTIRGMINGSGGSNPSSQSGESLFVGSIITGLRKTDKLTISPYNYYHHFLNNSTMKNSSLLIVGYSFGDLYVNDLIERMNLLHGDKKRIVVITYIQYEQFKECDGTITKTFHGKDFELDSINHHEYLFLKRMMYDDSFELKELDKTIIDESSYTSKNGQVKLFVYGFKSAVEKHSDEIIDFLTK